MPEVPKPIEIKPGATTPEKVAKTATILAQGAQQAGASTTEAIAAAMELAVKAAKTDAPAETED